MVIEDKTILAEIQMYRNNFLRDISVILLFGVFFLNFNVNLAQIISFRSVMNFKESFSSIFDPSGVNNSSVYSTVHCTALWCTVVHFGGVG